jgi:hypothetical protein
MRPHTKCTHYHADLHNTNSLHLSWHSAALLAIAGERRMALLIVLVTASLQVIRCLSNTTIHHTV